MLIENRLNKSWSLLASFSAELLVVSILIIVPLIYGDHLPEFHWKTVTVGPAARPVHLAPARTHEASGPVPPIFRRPPLIANPIRATQTSLAASGLVAIDLPPGIEIAGSDGAAPGPQLFERIVNVTPPVAEPHAPAPATAPVQVSKGVQMAKLVKQVIPAYPPMARSARISGVVHLVGIISKDGTIRNLQLISGHPLLAKAALDAVAQWIYKPTLLSGQAVEVICPIDVDFKLGQ
jgi:protein TonB